MVSPVCGASHSSLTSVPRGHAVTDIESQIANFCNRSSSPTLSKPPRRRDHRDAANRNDGSPDPTRQVTDRRNPHSAINPECDFAIEAAEMDVFAMSSHRQVGGTCAMITAGGNELRSTTRLNVRVLRQGMRTSPATRD